MTAPTAPTVVGDGNGLTSRLEGPAPAFDVAVDIAKRSLWLVPVAVLVPMAIWGLNGSLSALYAVAIVVVNFVLSAWLLAVTGRISIALMMGSALFGYILRLGLIFLAVMLVKDQAWVELVPLGITLIVTHLGLLFWELRYISGSLAFPGLKPPPPARPERGTDSSDSIQGSIT